MKRVKTWRCNGRGREKSGRRRERGRGRWRGRGRVRGRGRGRVRVRGVCVCVCVCIVDDRWITWVVRVGTIKDLKPIPSSRGWACGPSAHTYIIMYLLFYDVIGVCVRVCVCVCVCIVDDRWITWVVRVGTIKDLKPIPSSRGWACGPSAHTYIIMYLLFYDVIGVCLIFI